MSFRLSRGEAEGQSETRELCRAPNPRIRYSRSNLYHAGVRVFERLATCGNKKVWVMSLFKPHFLTKGAGT